MKKPAGFWQVGQKRKGSMETGVDANVKNHFSHVMGEDFLISYRGAFWSVVEQDCLAVFVLS